MVLTKPLPVSFHAIPPSHGVSPVLREFAGKSGVIQVPSPTQEDPNRKEYIPYVLVPLGMKVVVLPEALNQAEGFLEKLPLGMP